MMHLQQLLPRWVMSHQDGASRTGDTGATTGAWSRDLVTLWVPVAPPAQGIWGPGAAAQRNDGELRDEPRASLCGGLHKSKIRQKNSAVPGAAVWGSFTCSFLVGL